MTEPTQGAPVDTTAPATPADTAPTSLLGGEGEQPAVDNTNNPAAAAEGEQPKVEGDAGEGEGKKEEGKPEGAPETYADFEMPEGFELDSETADEFKSLAKELNLNQEAAQKLVNVGAKLAERISGQPMAVLEEASAEWTKQTQNDPEFGGAKLQENLAVAKRALDTFGTPELRQLLNESRLGNHPELIRFIHRVGKGMSEDGIVRGDAGGSRQPSRAETLYGDQNK